MHGCVRSMGPITFADMCNDQSVLPCIPVLQQ